MQLRQPMWQPHLAGQCHRRSLAAAMLLGLSLSAMNLEAQTRGPYDMPNNRPNNQSEKPIEFAAHEPHRPNALDFLGTINGYAMLRYQRATNSSFSLIFEVNGYIHLANLFHLLSASQYTLGTVEQDLRTGAGLGLAFWPWQKLRKGYISLRSQLQLQSFKADSNDQNFSFNRILVGNTLEIGTRLGKRILSGGVCGGLGFQVPINTNTVLPENFTLPMIYAYLGFSLGLNFR